LQSCAEAGAALLTTSTGHLCMFFSLFPKGYG
jgi:hypothetical protein